MTILKMTMKIKHSDLLSVVAALFLFSFFLSGNVCAKPLSGVELRGFFFVRLPGQHDFIAQNYDYLPANTMVLVKPDTKNPMASGSVLIVGSHSIILYPGATLRLLADAVYPISGRFAISAAENAEPLRILTKNFIAEYISGNLLLEITPDNGTYVVMRDKGNAWLKDAGRKIFQLQPGQELFFPLFGATVEQRLSSFWSEPPTSFGAARHSSDSLKR